MYILKTLSLKIFIFFFFIILLNGSCTYWGYTIGYNKDVHTGGEIMVFKDIGTVEQNTPVKIYCENDTVSGIYQGLFKKSIILRRTDWVDSTQYILRENVIKIQVTTTMRKTNRTLGTIIGLTCDVLLLWFILDQWDKSFNPVSLKI